MIRVCHIALAALLAVSARASSSVAPEEAEFFEKSIRPVLASECYECHGAKKQKGGLRLDFRDGWKKGGESGAVIVPGRPGQSLLLKSIRHEDPDLKMPTKRPKLSDAVIASFEKWIALGAPDPRDEPPKADAAVSWERLLADRKTWWSLQPVRPATPPAVQQPGWSAHPVDRFLLAKMDAHNLTPAADADPRAVLRRLTFALTGLPPTAEETASFVEAVGRDLPAAVAAAADRLLASPRFGEHWARHWMDLVRFAETHGSEGDPDIPQAWRYRDYLIRAFNTDVPLDQLIREHLAGDLLEMPRWNPDEKINESLLGLTHLRLVEHGFQPVDTRDEQVKVIDSQIDVAMKAFQALTVSCARCHDHKFDAISQRDYYALAGVFESSRPAMVTIDAPELLAQNTAELQALKTKIRAGLVAAWKEEPARISARLLAGEKMAEPAVAPETKGKAKAKGAPSEKENPLNLWTTLHDLSGDAMAKAWTDLADAERQRAPAVEPRASRRWNFADGSGDYAACFHYGTGLAPAPGACGDFSIASEGDRVLTGLLPAGVATHRLSTKHGGVFTTPGFRVETDSITVRAWGGGGAQVRLIADGYPIGTNPIFPRAQLGRDEPAWLRLDTAYRKGTWAYLEFATADDQTRPEKRDSERSWFGVSEIVCGPVGKPGLTPFTALLRGAPPRSAGELAQRYADALATALAAWGDSRLDEAQRLLLDALIRRETLPSKIADLAALAPLMTEYRRLEAGIPVPRRAPGVFEAESRDAAFLPRGDPLQPGEPVPRGYLGVFGGAPFHESKSGRLELSRAITDPRNPLTARVMANRIWLHVFGRGLVATPDNFGRMGASPTHPELLDFLAARLAEDGWSLKKTLRFLVTTRAFGRASEPPPAARERDGANDLLTHFPVRRLGAEAVRDSLLAISGRLAPAQPGPGFAVGDRGDKLRASVYLTIRRNALSPFLEVFDAPKPFTTIGLRDTTNVPAQSLALLNDPFVIDCAAAWARQLIAGKADATTDARIHRMFIEAFARPPTAPELAASRRYLGTDDANPAARLASQPAWSDFAQSLFNLKEFIFLP
ncbi:MAG: PSD1 and planctomycete cytochrome C domain-containing protein [Chthoniobacter sp.]|nr:PSD1 and planctomycete cytochrome C domain-containing protein [Chthoniobacter sp.]